MPEIELAGLRGDKVLGFLAAIGTVRLLEAAGLRPRLSWATKRPWTARFHLGTPSDADAVVSTLARALADGGASIAGPLGNELLGADHTAKLPIADFAQLAREAADAATPDRRLAADFLASLGTEASGTGVIADTGLRARGGGNEKFLKGMRELIAETTPEQIRQALFTDWAYTDGRPSMRWDTVDIRRYALRSDDPKDSKVAPIRTVRGANRLAIEALPWFPVVPAIPRPKTVGFDDTRFCWPIWGLPLSAASVRSLLALSAIASAHEPQARFQLRARGVVEVFSSLRQTTGRYRNFLAPQPTWGA